jgi:hypothetical protein
LDENIQKEINTFALSTRQDKAKGKVKGKVKGKAKGTKGPRQDKPSQAKPSQAKPSQDIDKT